MEAQQSSRDRIPPHRWLLLVGWLYLFLVSIGLLGKAFKMLGKPLIHTILGASGNPLVALAEGVLATTIVQSSSSTTSVVVALAAAGTLPVASAIFLIMGANIGTTVTNTLVSLGHISRSNEFKRAFAASTVHDFFNVIAVLLLLPIQMSTNVLGRMAQALAKGFESVGGLKFTSPLKLATGPLVHLVAGWFKGHPWLLVLVAMILLFGSLRQLVVVLRGLVVGKVEAFFDEVVFKSAGRAMFLGLALTAVVQSSSVTTSLVVPLAGAGLLKLRQIFPYTLGANVGTTLTAILAALATGNPVGLTVAFAHLLFNACGIALIWPIRQVRAIPMRLASALAEVATRAKWLALIYVLGAFYALPLGIIFLLR